MTPKQTAKQLVNLYLDNIPFSNKNIQRAKQCALIAVELSLKHCNGKDMNEEFDKTLFLVKVKHEIEKI